MKIDTVKINYGRTINMGNYESTRLDVELSATLAPGEDAGKVADELRAQAKLQINKWITYELNGRNSDGLNDEGIPW